MAAFSAVGPDAVSADHVVLRAAMAAYAAAGANRGYTESDLRVSLRWGHHAWARAAGPVDAALQGRDHIRRGRPISPVAGACSDREDNHLARCRVRQLRHAMRRPLEPRGHERGMSL